MGRKRDVVSAGKSGAAADERLDSWKEIAAFFGRDERTVKRWETRRGLPLHRLPGGGGAKVYAYRAELQSWLTSGAAGEAGAGEVRGDPAFSATRRRWIRSLVLFGAAIALVVGAFWIGRLSWSSAAGSGASRGAASRAAGRGHDPVAVEFYRTGLYYWHARTPESLHQAVDYFTQAIVRDPAYAEAYAGLADAYNLLREFSEMSPQEAYPRAKAAAERAVALDPNLAEGHASLGFVDFYWTRDTPAARREFERALQLDPRSAIAHHWYANVLAALGQDDRALAEIGVAQSLDPGSSAILADRGLILLGEGRTEDAVTLLESLEATAPNFLSPHKYLSYAYMTLGRDEDALREMAAAARLLHDDRRVAVAQAAEQGLASGGRQGMFRALLAEKLKLHADGAASAFEVAQAYAAAGMAGQAMAMLRTSVERHEPDNIGMARDTAFAKLRGQSEFRRLLLRSSTPATYARVAS